MAVTSVPVSSDLILVIDNGIGAVGQQLILNRAVRDLKPAEQIGYGGSAP